MTDPARGHTSATLWEASGLRIDLDTSIRPLWPGARLAGPAYTVQGAGGDNLALHQAIAHAPQGSVLVADLDGARYGHFGEVMAVAARSRGIAGLLIDGGARDAAEQQALGFPVFSRNNAIRGTRKSAPAQLQVPINVGGRVIHPGDLIVADIDGIVAIPAREVARVLDAADARIAKESRLMDALRSGSTTLELFSLPDRGENA